MILAGSKETIRLNAPTPIRTPDSKSERYTESPQFRSFKAVQHSLQDISSMRTT